MKTIKQEKCLLRIWISYLPNVLLMIFIALATYAACYIWYRVGRKSMGNQMAEMRNDAVRDTIKNKENEWRSLLGLEENENFCVNGKPATYRLFFRGETVEFEECEKLVNIIVKKKK